MALNLGALAHNRRAQLAVGGAVAVGGYALYRRRKAAASSSATTTDATGSTTPATYVPGQFPDTSGTDVAAWLSQAEPGIEADVAAYIAAHPTTPDNPAPGTPNPGSGGPTTNPKPKPKPPAPKPPTGQQFVTVTKYTGSGSPWSSTLSGIAGHDHETIAQLLKLNPDIKNPNVIHTGERIRVK